MHDTNNLKATIAARIRDKGRITFADYMAACLYEPELGYYTSPGRKVGAAGDFYTSSNVHAAFGRIISREIARMHELMGCPSAFTIVEAGAAAGRLARDILDGARDLSPRLYAALRYVLIEKEPSLREVQREMLGPHADLAEWRSPEELGSGFSFSGCLLSNELIDSFPVHLVQMTPDGLREVYVTLSGDDFAEELGEPSTPEIATYLQAAGVELYQAQRAEVNLAAGRWLEGVARSLERGFVLTIDYGYTATDLFSPMRRTGTLLCYHRHQVQENPYERVGEQDITTHIDFTTLMRRGEELGLQTAWYGEQYRFLLGAGLMEELMALEVREATPEQKLKDRLALKKLMLPEGGMGDVFKVLIQAKGIENPRLLCMQEWGC